MGAIEAKERMAPKSGLAPEDKMVPEFGMATEAMAVKVEAGVFMRVVSSGMSGVVTSYTIQPAANIFSTPAAAAATMHSFATILL